LPGPLQALAGDSICAQLRFDKVKRNLYYACNEGDHVRVTVGHVNAGQRTGIAYANYNGPRTPGGGDVLNLFPALATDAAGHVYMAWIDATSFALYYAFSTNEGRSWSAPVRVNSGGAVTNEFDWAQAGAAGTLALAWYSTDKAVPGGSDNMPSSLTDLGNATKYQWFGYAALVTKADTARPKVAQARFTAKPMHYGAICNAGTACATDLSADRQMADFFGFDIGKDGGLRIVFNDTTNELDGAGLHYTRQIAGTSALGSNVSGKAAANPVTDPAGRRQLAAPARAGRRGANIPQLDLDGPARQQSQPDHAADQDDGQGPDAIAAAGGQDLFGLADALPGALAPAGRPGRRLPHLLRLHGERRRSGAHVLRRNRDLSVDDPH
jgi:hypothetical protein